ncbi:MAG: hypothetical protein U5J64_11885 [Halobacteriales archaeon]|nr:hypothetical protein [Halobacteriales archaeon]
MIVDKALVFGEIVVLSMALPLAVIAALGFRGSPFGKVMAPIPVAISAYLLVAGIIMIFEPVPILLYLALSVVGALAAVYSVANAVLLLSERRLV